VTDTPTGVDAAPVLAVDLGGTNTRVAVVDATGEIRERHVEHTAREDMHPDELIRMMRRASEGTSAVSAVVGVPGRVDHAEGRLEFAPNLPAHWAAHLTEERLAGDTRLRVSLANDADLAAVGEHRFGAGRGVDDMVYLTLSTGVGCGVIVGGLLLHGRRSLAEAGHVTIDRSAVEGRRTLEQTASGTAMNRLADARGLSAHGRDLVELVGRGDPAAIAVWKDVVAAAGLGVAGLAHLFSPQLVVVGGGLGLAGEVLYEPVRSALEAHGPQDLPQPIEVVAAELGDDAGLAGAAGWTAAFAQHGKMGSSEQGPEPAGGLRHK
jgi:glucokinase